MLGAAKAVRDLCRIVDAGALFLLILLLTIGASSAAAPSQFPQKHVAAPSLYTPALPLLSGEVQLTSSERIRDRDGAVPVAPPSKFARPVAKSFWGAVDQNANLTAQVLPQMSRFHNDEISSGQEAVLQELQVLGIPKKSKLLIMPPMLFDSHMFIFTSIAAELFRRYGHETTLLLGDRRHPVKAQQPNFAVQEEMDKLLDPETVAANAAADAASPTGSRGVHVKRYPSLFSTEEAQAFLQPRVHNILSGFPMIAELYEILGRYTYNCDLLFTEGKPVIEDLRQESFDFVLVDPNEICGFLLAKELGLPHAALSTGMWTPAEAAIPQPVSYVPEFNSLQTDRMGFLGRLINLGAYMISRVGTHLAIFPLYNALIRKHGITGPASLNLEIQQGRRKDVAEVFHRTGLLSVAKRWEAKSPRNEEDSKLNTERAAARITEWVPSMVARTKAWLVCSDFALDFPRPYLPNVEYVGGILGRPGRPLPSDLQAWADSASEGFVVVTFGAAVEKLTPRLQRVFVEGLSMIPHPVIWRFPREAGGEIVSRSNQLGSNVKLVDWLPQNDLLAHPNCALFVGHGGTNGAYEALYHGVPVVGMPLFGDHYDSTVRIEAKGFGKFLRWKSLTAERLVDAAMSVLADPEMKARAKFLSRVHRDIPGGSALTRAVDRLDYTLRYKGADHLRPAVYEIGTMQFWYVDAMLITLAVALSIALVVRCGHTIISTLSKLLQDDYKCNAATELPLVEKHRDDWEVSTSSTATSPHGSPCAERGGGGVVKGVVASIQQRIAMILLRLRAATRNSYG